MRKERRKMILAGRGALKEHREGQNKELSTQFKASRMQQHRGTSAHYNTYSYSKFVVEHS